MNEKTSAFVYDEGENIQNVSRGDHQNWQGWETTVLHPVQEHVEHTVSRCHHTQGKCISLKGICSNFEFCILVVILVAVYKILGSKRDNSDNASIPF